VPIQCEYYALEGLGQLLRNVRLIQQNVNPELRLSGIVMTMFDARTKLSEQVVAEVRRYFGARVFDTVIPRTVRLSEAPGYGQPITLYDPMSRGAIMYRSLAKELAERGPEDEALPQLGDLPNVIPPAEPPAKPSPPERAVPTPPRKRAGSGGSENDRAGVTTRKIPDRAPEPEAPDSAESTADLAPDTADAPQDAVEAAEPNQVPSSRGGESAADVVGTEPAPSDERENSLDSSGSDAVEGFDPGTLDDLAAVEPDEPRVQVAEGVVQATESELPAPLDRSDRESAAQVPEPVAPGGEALDSPNLDSNVEGTSADALDVVREEEGSDDFEVQADPTVDQGSTDPEPPASGLGQRSDRVDAADEPATAERTRPEESAGPAGGEAPRKKFRLFRRGGEE